MTNLSAQKLLLLWALCLLLVSSCYLSPRFLAGMPLFVAPLVYMVVVRRWGLVAGLMAALLTTLPTTLWGGGPVFVALALAEVVFLHWRGQRRSLMPSTAVFSLATFILMGIPLLCLRYGESFPMVMPLLAPRVFNNLTCATLADLFLAKFRLAADGRIIQQRRPRPLVPTIRLAIQAGLLGLLGVVGLMSMDLISETHHLRRDFGPFQHMQIQAVRNAVSELTVNRVVYVPTRSFVGKPSRVAAARRPELLDEKVAQRLNCTLNSSVFVSRKLDLNIDTCSSWPIRLEPEGAIYILISDREARLSSYAKALNQLIPVAMLAVLMAVAMARVQRDVGRNTKRWGELLEGFGRRRLVVLPGNKFAELSEPLERFVAVNNAFIQSKQIEAEHLEAFVALEQSLDLRVISDLRYFPREGEFRFETVVPDGERVREAFKVHPRDRANVKRSLGQDVTLEVCSAEREDQWHMIYAEQKQADGAYARGLILRLRQPRAAIMRHFNRLTELGLTTAATAHELQQSMFAIGLLAEQGAALAEEGPAARADLLGVFQRLKGQSERGTRIIDRVTRRARPEGEEEEHLNMEEVFSYVVSDLRVQLSAAGAQVQIECNGAAAFAIRAPRVAMEQVLINAMRNAIDAVAARCGQPGVPPGLIRVDMGLTDQGEFRLTLEDNGIGLGSAVSEHLFEAFYTTKLVGEGTGLGLFVCRDIVEEWGGRVSLTNAELGGACWTLTIPATRIST